MNKPELIEQSLKKILKEMVKYHGRPMMNIPSPQWAPIYYSDLRSISIWMTFVGGSLIFTSGSCLSTDYTADSKPGMSFWSDKPGYVTKVYQPLSQVVGGSKGRMHATTLEKAWKNHIYMVKETQAVVQCRTFSVAFRRICLLRAAKTFLETKDEEWIKAQDWDAWGRGTACSDVSESGLITGSPLNLSKEETAVWFQHVTTEFKRVHAALLKRQHKHMKNEGGNKPKNPFDLDEDFDV